MIEGIIVDGQRAFVLGASIKDAGKRAFNIIPIEAPSAPHTRISFRKSPFLKPGSAQNLAQIF